MKKGLCKEFCKHKVNDYHVKRFLQAGSKVFTKVEESENIHLSCFFQDLCPNLYY